jgi:hypothetical protein
MFKHIVRNLAFVITLAVLSTSAIHAQIAGTHSAVPSVTGGDPEPTSPTVHAILVFLHLA